MDLSIRTVETPNPNARQYMVNRPVQESPKGRFYKPGDETDEPLVKALLEIEGAQSVMLLPNSITVNKANGSSWDDVDAATRRAIEDYFA